ncbi:MAG: outer membrane beta-barrel protein [Candidatus Aminicenantes bacterium]|nr:outer membrane beta-barrel protein [Candidatus Aminicenantes bacterium]
MRKKTMVLCLTILLVGSMSFAQAKKRPIDKGSFNVAGAVSFSSSSGEFYGDEAISSFSLMPSARYFVIDGLAVGLDLLLQTDSDGNDTETTFGLGPAVAYMFDVNSPSIYPYVGVGVAFGSHSASWSRYSTTALIFKLGGGVAFMVKRNLALLAELGYSIESYKYELWDKAESGGTFSVSLGLSAFIY